MLNQVFLWISKPETGLILLVLSFFLLCLCFKNSHDKNSLKKRFAENETKLLLSNQKLTDLIKQAETNEAEKRLLQENITIAERNLAAETAAAAEREQALNDKIAYLEKIKEDLTLKFKDISNEIIKAQHETFSLEQKNTLSAVMTPFADELKAFKTEVVAAREESIKNKSSLDTELNNLRNLNLTLSQDAQNLAEALKGGKKQQGNWGECQLSRILEISGLKKGIDYETQETYVNEDKKIYRPDVIIHLPDNRDIIVDSKVSLNDYLEAINSEDESARNKSLLKNVVAVKAHIDELSAKEYQKLIKENNTLNFVIMFIPVESAYIAALETDKEIYDYAYKKNVILATPLSLLPTLRTVENLWRFDKQNQNAAKIAELGGKIYDKLVAYVEDMNSLERGLNQANNAYKNAMTKLSGRGGALSSAEKMKQLGAKTNKTVNLPLNDNELLLEHDQDEIITDDVTLAYGEQDNA